MGGASTPDSSQVVGSRAHGACIPIGLPLYVALISMHSPTALPLHAYWLVAMIAGVFGLFLASAVASVVAWRRARAA